MTARTEVEIFETKEKLVRHILEITDGIPNGSAFVTDLLKSRIDLEMMKQLYRVQG